MGHRVDRKLEPVLLGYSEALRVDGMRPYK